MSLGGANPEAPGTGANFLARHSSLVTEAMRLHYTVSGGGPLTVVLTHGLAASGETWSGIAERLALRHRVLTWDLRGHGRSPAPEGPYTIGDLAHDLVTILDDAGIQRAVVLGHSAGGVIALQFALDHPARTAGLVLVGTASECNARAHEFYGDLARRAEEIGMADVHRRLGLSGDQEPAVSAEPRAFAKVARCMGNLYHQPLTARLGQIHAPALVCVGEKDFLGVGGSVILSRKIAGARLEIVPGRGHGIFLEDPDGFAHLVGEFLDASVCV
jgi:3-oxoadipate enol-lactonase